MKSFLCAALLLSIVASPTAAQTTVHPTPAGLAPPVFTKFQDLKWTRLEPELGDASAEITILHVDPASGATQLMIRAPKNHHAKRHWHTANETHMVVSGTFIMKHDGSEELQTLGPGSFNYMPAKMIHDAWSPPNEGNLVFITVDGPWDLYLVDDPNGKMPPK